jgi:hypothetical protein
MATDVQTLKQVAALAVRLAPEDKIRLIEIVASALERDLTSGEAARQAAETPTQVIDLTDGSPTSENGAAA